MTASDTPLPPSGTMMDESPYMRAWATVDALDRAAKALHQFGVHAEGCVARVLDDGPCDCGLYQDQAAAVHATQASLVSLRVLHPLLEPAPAPVSDTVSGETPKRMAWRVQRDQFQVCEAPGVWRDVAPVAEIAPEIEGRDPDPAEYPEPLPRLGKRLAELLDDDQFNGVEPMLHEVGALLGAAHASSAPEGRELPEHIRRIATEVLECADGWTPAACLVGNVAAGDIAKLCRFVLAGAAPEGGVPSDARALAERIVYALTECFGDDDAGMADRAAIGERYQTLKRELGSFVHARFSSRVEFVELLLAARSAPEAETSPEVKRLRAIIERERTAACEWIERLRRLVGSRELIASSRGPYEWDDDEYFKEFGSALDAISKALERAARDTHARDLSDCPTTQAEVEAARSELAASVSPSSAPDRDKYGLRQSIASIARALHWSIEERRSKDSLIDRVARELVKLNALAPNGWTDEDLAKLLERAAPKAAASSPSSSGGATE